MRFESGLPLGRVQRKGSAAKGERRMEKARERDTEEERESGEDGTYQVGLAVSAGPRIASTRE